MHLDIKITALAKEVFDVLIIAEDGDQVAFLENRIRRYI